MPEVAQATHDHQSLLSQAMRKITESGRNSLALSSFRRELRREFYKGALEDLKDAKIARCAVEKQLSDQRRLGKHHGVMEPMVEARNPGYLRFFRERLDVSALSAEPKTTELIRTLQGVLDDQLDALKWDWTAIGYDVPVERRLSLMELTKLVLADEMIGGRYETLTLYSHWLYGEIERQHGARKRDLKLALKALNQRLRAIDMTSPELELM